MPTTSQYAKFIYVNIGFVAQIAAMIYFRSAMDIKQNWPLYRCNPTYWVFSDNIANDFTYCVQNTQMNMMSYLLQPVNYMISSLATIGGDVTNSLNDVRIMFSTIRTFVSDIIQNVFGVFLNMIVEFQKIIISIKDLVGKMIGIVVTILYVLDGSVKTMNSAWAGPPGQLVKSIGSCFHPFTDVELANGKKYTMEQVPLGATLKGGGKVFSVMRIDNSKGESMYMLDGVLVTGEHFVWNAEDNQWMQVKNHKQAIAYPELIPPYFVCLITTNRRILLNNTTFWDWEDDELHHRQSVL